MPAKYNLGTLRPLLVALAVAKLLLVSHFAIANEPIISNESAHPVPPKILFKLDQNGERLSHESKQWQCVEDASTGLFWQKRDPSSAMHGLDSYVWYQPQHKNSGTPRANPEDLGLDVTCHGYHADDPTSFCNTDAFITRVNQSNYCGYSDWRLPNADELLSLTDPALAGRPFQAPVDLRYFPFYDNFVYWSDTVNEQGIVVTLIKGYKLLTNSKRSDRLLVRLVRGTAIKN